MVVMRMIAQNSDQDHRQGIMPSQQQQQQQPPPPQQQPSLRQQQSYNGASSYGGGNGGGVSNVNGSSSSSLTHEEREALKMRTLQVSRVIVNARECNQLVEELFRSGHPIGLDGEGVNLGPKGNFFIWIRLHFHTIIENTYTIMKHKI
jgi:hypothetical protein